MVAPHAGPSRGLRGQAPQPIVALYKTAKLAPCSTAVDSPQPRHHVDRFKRHSAVPAVAGIEAKELVIGRQREAIVEGAAQRIRPKLMAVLTTMIGLVPIMWSTGTGADVMRRIAAPMVGGLVSSFLLQLTIYPAIFAIWKRSKD